LKNVDYVIEYGYGKEVTLKSMVDDMLNEFPAKEKQEFADSDALDLIQYHTTLGRYIRNKYHLWYDEALCLLCGKKHPDDASFVVIEMMWMKLNSIEAVSQYILDKEIQDEIEKPKTFRAI
jgi:hypothetical protein